MKKLLFIFLGSTAFACIAVSVYISSIYKFAERANGSGETGVFFTIKPGESFSSISQRLFEKNIIDDVFRFKLYAFLEKKDKNIKTGEYLISPAMTPKEILYGFVKAKVHLYRFTIPEGKNIKQIGEIVEASGLCGKEEFINTAMDEAYARSYDLPHKTFEGYLFPETYYFPKNATAKDIIRSMMNRFNAIISDDWKRRAGELGMSVHEIVTLASIIEKETGDAEERPVISSVFHNRLKRGMRLEADPTVIYGIKNFDGDIKKKDLKEKTPYNTYVIKGLPPGPIASPGYESLKAALHPADTKYLFFVAKGNGSHFFSRTYGEHKKAVRKYQLKGR